MQEIADEKKRNFLGGDGGSSCPAELFGFWLSLQNQYQVLGEALVKAGGKGLEKQLDAANSSLSSRIAAITARAATARESGTIESGLSYQVGDPVTAYTDIKKWNGTEFADAYKDDGTKYTEPPARDDPNGPGLWRITMSIKCTVTTQFQNYSNAGWTFSGNITQEFDAEYVWELDIPGEPGGQATSTQKSAETDMTISGELQISGKDSGTLTFDSMKFHIREDDTGKRECTYNTGSAWFGATDVTDDLIDPIEEGFEKLRI
ncbi:MAG: hypothetical protein ACOYVH_00705 [Spirochaetota bacterium]